MIGFNNCLDKINEIKSIDEQIEELEARIMSPKSQKITGMPRGGGVMGGLNEEYIIRKEKLEQKRQRLIQRHLKLWKNANNRMIEAGVKDDERFLMWLRFHQGFSWRKCCNIMQKNYPNDNWNTNKVFRVYRNILKK